MKLTNEQKTAIKTFLNSLNAENLDIAYHVEIEEIDFSNAFDSITEMLENQNAFDVEIIYYSNAIEYLSNNDASLHECMSIASEMGYETKNLNSELLASLLASQNCRNEFYELQSEIDEFFQSMCDEIEEE